MLVVITGGTQGLGRAMAVEFVARGHQVAACGRNAEALAGLEDEAPGVATAAVDVSDEAAVSAWAGDVNRRFGAPDLLLNNAALINSNAPLWEVPADEFATVVDVNIKGVTSVIRHFVPAMIARGEGVIVNFSSGWGRSVAADVAPYCATKWAIEGLTQALALELPRGLAAIPLNPGIINTEMLQSCFGAGAGQFPTAQAWARTAVPFLLELGPQHNGQPLSVPI